MHRYFEDLDTPFSHFELIKDGLAGSRARTFRGQDGQLWIYFLVANGYP